jgi:hypothetical protein
VFLISFTLPFVLFLVDTGKPELQLSTEILLGYTSILMAKFTDLPPEVRQKIFAYVLDPSQIADVKLSVNHTSALALSQVSHQFRADSTIVHAAWRKEHTLDSILSEEWNDDGLEMSRQMDNIVGEWRERAGLNDGESGADDDLEEVRVIAVLDWVRKYMVHLRARSMERKQRNKELEQHMQVQREVLLEWRKECERLNLQVEVLREGLDRITLD